MSEEHKAFKENPALLAPRENPGKWDRGVLSGLRVSVVSLGLVVSLAHRANVAPRGIQALREGREALKDRLAEMESRVYGERRETEASKDLEASQDP